MIDVSSKIKKAFQNDSMQKNWFISFPNIDEGADFNLLTNDDLVEDSIKISENLCSDAQLKFGKCEGNIFEFEMVYNDYSIVGEVIDVYLILGDYTDEPFVVGRYLITDEKIANDRLTKAITAYDILSVLNELDVTYWYYMEIEFPITLKNYRDSLLEYVGQEQVEKELPNDDIVLETSPLDGESDINFNTIMSGICEFNGVFGGINRNGLFDYYTLTAEDQEETYPSESTFPSSETFPKSIKGKNYFIDPHLIKDDITWANYVCKPIDIIQVRNKNGVAILDYTIPEKTGTNIYVIQSNHIVDGLSSSELTKAVERFAQQVYKITYIPCTANVKMDLSYEVGDAITLTSTKGTRLPTFILKRTATGGMSAFDEIDAQGNEEYENEIAAGSDDYEEIYDDLDDLSDRVSDLEENGGIVIESVPTLPESPRKNVLYLVQGEYQGSGFWVT